MKKTAIILILALLAPMCGMAQKVAYESAMQSFGYKNDDGSWKIAPRYQRAGEFEGSVRKWAPVKLDGHWGCIDIDGNLICRNLFRSAAHQRNFATLKRA